MSLANNDLEVELVHTEDICYKPSCTWCCEPGNPLSSLVAEELGYNCLNVNILAFCYVWARSPAEVNEFIRIVSVYTSWEFGHEPLSL